MALMLLEADATVTVAHSPTPKTVPALTRQTADIVVSAIGRPQFLTADYVHPGASRD
jgi:methylenetetrahydrofolate dehydrogenase (NADP+)/methenyltetrahydrofolate cyclohydrolase